MKGPILFLLNENGSWVNQNIGWCRHIGDIEAWIKELKQLTRLKKPHQQKPIKKEQLKTMTIPYLLYFFWVSLTFWRWFLCEFHLQNLHIFKKQSDAYHHLLHSVLVVAEGANPIRDFLPSGDQDSQELVCGWGMVLLLLLLLLWLWLWLLLLLLLLLLLWRCLWDETWKNTIRMQICFCT